MSKSRLILIVEDNDSFRLLVHHLLSKDYVVVSKGNGIAATQWLFEGNIPDLILLDLEMPEMSGIDFLEGLRSSGFCRNIPVIIISGNDSKSFFNRTLPRVQHFFEKPFDPQKLQEKIQHLLADSSAIGVS